MQSRQRERQRFNQAVWSRIEVDVDRVCGAAPTDPMAVLLTEDLLKVVGAETTDSEHLVVTRGSRFDVFGSTHRIQCPSGAVR